MRPCRGGSSTPSGRPWCDGLPARLLADAGGDDIFRLRRDAVEVARALQLVAPPAPAAAQRPEAWLTTPRLVALAVAAGVPAGVLLALLLARTAFAPPVHCRTYAGGTFTCARG